MKSTDLNKIEVNPKATPQRTNPLANVFDELVRFCRSRSMFMLHYCTGCGAIELPPAMTSRFDMERLEEIIQAEKISIGIISTPPEVIIQNLSCSPKINELFSSNFIFLFSNISSTFILSQLIEHKHLLTSLILDVYHVLLFYQTP